MHNNDALGDWRYHRYGVGRFALGLRDRDCVVLLPRQTRGDEMRRLSMVMPIKIRAARDNAALLESLKQVFAGTQMTT
jgi:hypothetical protein